MKFHVYILYSKSLDRYYIGSTGDALDERIRRHNTNHGGFTGGRGDWHLMYCENYPDKKSAQVREKDIKKWKSRKMIEKLIGSKHPD